MPSTTVCWWTGSVLQRQENNRRVAKSPKTVDEDVAEKLTGVIRKYGVRATVEAGKSTKDYLEQENDRGYIQD